MGFNECKMLFQIGKNEYTYSFIKPRIKVQIKVRENSKIQTSESECCNNFRVLYKYFTLGTQITDCFRK